MKKSVVGAVDDDDGGEDDAPETESLEAHAAVAVDAGDSGDVVAGESSEARAAVILPFLFDRDDSSDSTFRDGDAPQLYDGAWDFDSNHPDYTLPLRPRILTSILVFEGVEWGRDLH